MIVEEALEKSRVKGNACCGCSIITPWFLVDMFILRSSRTAGRGERFFTSAMARRLEAGPSAV